MAQLITQSIPALFNGVSQQPPTLRLASQAEAEVNCYSTIVDGVQKRPNFDHVVRVTTGTWKDQAAHIHMVNRDVTERYIVVITDGDLKVYDLAGVEQTVAFPNGKTYLTVGAGFNARDAFAVVTIADYSFIVNKSVTVAMKAVAADQSLPAQWADYRIPYYISGSGDVRFPDGEYLNPVVTAAKVKGKKQTFAELPDSTDAVPPVTDDIWEITGYDQDGFTSYWVIYTSDDVWEETVEPDLQNALDEDTMPYSLIREADGTFTFTPFKYQPRKIGDDKTNPYPSFVGRKINDVFFFKNRLGLLADENVIFSNSGDFGNYWRTTVTDLLDSDVVDIAMSSQKVSVLNFAVTFNERLQFALNVDQLLTPTSTSVDTVTEYEMINNVRPASIGTDVYFVTPYGDFSRIREYFVQKEENSNDTTSLPTCRATSRPTCRSSWVTPTRTCCSP
jgi:hypothetical protein